MLLAVVWMLIGSWIVAPVVTAADVACAEAGHDWREVDAVLQVVRNRSASTGKSLLTELVRPRQFARVCPPARQHWRHVWAGARMMVDALNVPPWLRDPEVRWFCAREVAWKWRQSDDHWSSRLRFVGRLRHLYWRG